jgi:hypothetical protein
LNQKPSNLETVFDGIAQAARENNPVTLGAIINKFGSRSFGILMLVPGLITLSPIIGDIPGVPTIMAIFVLFTAIQLLLDRPHFWFPDWLLRRKASSDHLENAIRRMRPAARFLDRYLRPRMTFLVQNGGVRGIASACIVIAASTPALELVPFSANGAGAALTVFGLALTAHDGLLALIAYFFTGITFLVVLFVLI